MRISCELVQCSKCCRYVKPTERARFRSWCKRCQATIARGETPECVLTPPNQHEALHELSVGNIV